MPNRQHRFWQRQNQFCAEYFNKGGLENPARWSSISGKRPAARVKDVMTRNDETIRFQSFNWRKAAGNRFFHTTRTDVIQHVKPAHIGHLSGRTLQRAAKTSNSLVSGSSSSGAIVLPRLSGACRAPRITVAAGHALPRLPKVCDVTVSSRCRHTI